jgi:hypothetical protein
MGLPGFFRQLRGKKTLPLICGCSLLDLSELPSPHPISSCYPVPTRAHDGAILYYRYHMSYIYVVSGFRTIFFCLCHVLNLFFYQHFEWFVRGL